MAGACEAPREPKGAGRGAKLRGFIAPGLWAEFSCKGDLFSRRTIPMKAYLLTTGILFTLIVGLHIWRIIDEWPPHGGAEFLSMIALTLLAAGLAAWAFVLVRRRRS